MYQSRWAPKHIQNGNSKHMDHGTAKSTSEKPVPTVSELQPQSSWSDPALKLIDEATNSMDIDFQPPTQQLVNISLVIDTNVLLSNLDALQQFVEDLALTDAPIWVVIPGIVVKELDYQKDDVDRALCWPARMASTWILSKLKDRKNLRGQSYQETLQQSGSWKKRDPGTSNDELIIDCCLYLRQKKDQNVLAISEDKNFCITAESQGIPTMNPRDYTRWSSRALAAFLFGENFPMLTRFATYKEKFRPKNMRQALDDELGVQPIPRSISAGEGMDIDDDFMTDEEPPPQHLLDDLHDQILDHFTILLADVQHRVAPATFKPPATSGSAKSVYADRCLAKPASEWQANEYLEYLCSSRRLPRTASAADTKAVVDDATRLINFFTPKYKARGRSGQHWSRADWISCLGTLGAVGRVYADDGISNSLTQLAPQVDDVFQCPMLPTGTG